MTFESGISYYYNAYSFPTNSLQVFYSFLTGTGSTIPSISPGNSQFSGSLFSGATFTGQSGVYFNSNSGSYLKINNATGLNNTNYTILISEQAALNSQGKAGGVLLSSLSTGSVSSGFLLGLNDNNQFFFYAYDSNENPICYTLEVNPGEKNLFGVTVKNNGINLFYYNFNYKTLEQNSYFTNYPLVFNPTWNIGNYPNNKGPFRPYNGCIDGFLLFNGALNTNQILTICSGFYSYPTSTYYISGLYNSGQITGYSSVYSGVTGITDYQNTLSGFYTGNTYEAVYNLLSGITGTYFTGSGIVAFDHTITQCYANQYIITGQGVLQTGVTGYVTGNNLLFSGSGLQPFYVLSIYTQSPITGFIYSGITYTPLYQNSGFISGYITGIYTDWPTISGYGMDTITYVSPKRIPNVELLYQSDFGQNTNDAKGTVAVDGWSFYGATAQYSFGQDNLYSNSSNPNNPVSTGWLYRNVGSLFSLNEPIGIHQSQNINQGIEYAFSFDFDSNSLAFGNSGFQYIGITTTSVPFGGNGGIHPNPTNPLLFTSGFISVQQVYTGQVTHVTGSFFAYSSGNNSPLIYIASGTSGQINWEASDRLDFYIKNFSIYQVTQDFIEYDYYNSGTNITTNNKSSPFNNATTQFPLDNLYNSTGINAWLNGVGQWGSGAFSATGIKQIVYLPSGNYFITGFNLQMDANFLSGTDLLLYDVFTSGNKLFLGMPPAVHVTGGHPENGGANNYSGLPFILTGNLINFNPVIYFNGIKLYSGKDYIITGTTAPSGGNPVTGLLAPTGSIFNPFLGSYYVNPTSGVFWMFDQYPFISIYESNTYDLIRTGKFARNASMAYLNGVRQQPDEYIEHSYLDLIQGEQIYQPNIPIINTNNQVFSSHV